MAHYYTNNKDTKSEPKNIRFVLNAYDFDFKTDNGVFSKNNVDYGTRVLLETMIEENAVSDKNRILDVGCGYGPIGIVLGTLFPKHRIDMVDINDRAIELTEYNVKNNKLSNVNVFRSNKLDSINDNYSMIISNPPIRAGKHIVHAIIHDAFNHLDDSGELWIVIQKKQGAPSAREKMLEVYGNAEIVRRDKGYYILKSIK